MELHRNNVKSSIDKLQARGDLFTRQLIKEKKRTNELQVKLKEVNERIETIRESNKQKAICLLNKYSTTPNDAYHRVDGVNPTSLAESNQKKIVKTLESRLGKALVRRNQLENENTLIKDKIDKLRRKIANDIKNRERMEKELIQIKDDMDVIMERAAAAADEREKLIVKRNQILEENEEKQLIFEKEYGELSHYIVMQAKALEDSIAKATDNVASKLSLAGKTLSKNNVASGSLNSSKEIKHLQGKLDRLENEYALTADSLKEHERKINSFEKKFKELQDVSGLESVDDIISTFVKNEDECFSMFNYIQAVNQDCDKTVKQASKLKKEIAKFRNEQVQKEKARSETVQVYQENLREVKEEREKLYQTAIQARRTAETIARRVTALYFKLKCHELDHQNDHQHHNNSSSNSLPPAHLRLDRKLTMISGEEVSEKDIMRQMESIERRAIQIINIYLKKESCSTRRARRQNSMLVSVICFVILSWYM